MKSNPTRAIAEKDALAIDKALGEFKVKCGLSAKAWITGNADGIETLNFLLADFNKLRYEVEKIRDKP